MVIKQDLDVIKKNLKEVLSFTTVKRVRSFQPDSKQLPLPSQIAPWWTNLLEVLSLPLDPNVSNHKEAPLEEIKSPFKPKGRPKGSKDKTVRQKG